MKRTLLDEGVPVGLVECLGSEDVRHVHDIRWAGISDGDLIARAVENRFDVIVTTDQNMAFQQNIRGRRIALVVVATTNWRIIRKRTAEIKEAIQVVKPGESKICVVTTKRG